MNFQRGCFLLQLGRSRAKVKLIEVPFARKRSEPVGGHDGLLRERRQVARRSAHVCQPRSAVVDYEEDEPLGDVLDAWNQSRKIRVDFGNVDSRNGQYTVLTEAKFATVPRNVVVGQNMIAVDAEGSEAQARVLSVSEEGLVALELTDWAPRGTGWCAPSP